LFLGVVVVLPLLLPLLSLLQAVRESAIAMISKIAINFFIFYAPKSIIFHSLILSYL